MKQNSFIILTTMISCNDQNRVNEFVTCLQSHESDSSVESVNILYENKDKNDLLYNTILDLQLTKIIITFVDHLFTFEELFKHANDNFHEQKVVLVNGDIVFSKNYGLNLLVDVCLKNKFIILTRHNWLNYYKSDKYLGTVVDTPEGQLKLQNNFSVDTWIFKTPININFECPFQFGRYGCDSMLNHQLLKSNFKVFNPCLDVISIHVDKNWSPSRYENVKLENGKIVPCCEYQKIMKNKGFSFSSTNFCHIKDID